MRGAAEGGVDVIALTDHDTVAGYAAAAEVGRQVGVEVVPAIEVSSTHGRRDVHILGYFVEPDSQALLDYTGRASGRREERMRAMLERLGAQGISLAFGAVEEAAGPDRVVIGRPHLARALVDAGYATSVHDAFGRLIGDDHPAFVPMQLLTPVGAVELVASAGGVPIWAHPPADLVDPLLPELRRAGLRGLEVYRPRHGRSDVLRYEGICRSSGFLMSGGSDWHSPEGGTALGDFFVTGDEVADLLEIGGI